MLSLLGAPALSDFRLQRLLADLRRINPGINAVASRFVHFVELADPMSDAQLLLLNRLLTYGPDIAPGAERGDKLTVTPRVGTVSPWSSKATDIARVCGLTSVRRLERGTVYFLDAAAALTARQINELAPLLYDRMTESVWLEHLSPERLFQ